MDLARWNESETQLRQALAESQAQANAKLVALASINLATLLQGTNRLEEAKPLLRLTLEILDSCGRQARHEQPYFTIVKANYKALQQAMRLDELD